MFSVLERCIVKSKYKSPEQIAGTFWAVHKRSKSGIAHLVEPEILVMSGAYQNINAHNPMFYVSCCGRRFAFWDINSAGASGITSPRCKRCMASKEKEQLK